MISAARKVPMLKSKVCQKLAHFSGENKPIFTRPVICALTPPTQRGDAFPPPFTTILKKQRISEWKTGKFFVFLRPVICLPAAWLPTASEAPPPREPHFPVTQGVGFETRRRGGRYGFSPSATSYGFLAPSGEGMEAMGTIAPIGSTGSPLQ